MKKGLLVILSVIFVACGDATHSPPSLESGSDRITEQPQEPGKTEEDRNCIPEGMPLIGFAEVKQVLFDVSCAQCHSAQAGNAAGINVDHFENIKRDLGRIGDSISSGRMPPGRPLSDEQLNTLAAWQNLGAPEFIEETSDCD